MPTSDPDASAPAGIHLARAAKTFGSGKAAIDAVAAIDLTFAPGTTTALVGPSGCGKSTLLRMVAGLEAPSAGTISIGADSPQTVSKRGALAVAFQDPSLLPWRTVAGNITLARRLAGKPRDPEVVQTWIDRVGLSGFETRRPAELSGGMRQRAAIARCLATDPSVLLLDEPFGAVDELTRRRLNVDLPPIWDQGGTTTILVTHSIVEAVLLSDRVIVLSHRPASILYDIPIPLTRPRREAMLSSPEFRALEAEVGAALIGETLRADPAPMPKVVSLR